MTNTGEAAAIEGQRTLKPSVEPTVRQAAVLGAGTMGASIAAHLSNAGIPTLLLDIAPDQLTEKEKSDGATLESASVRNRIVNSLFESAKKLRPSPFMLGVNSKLISTGNFTDD